MKPLLDSITFNVPDDITDCWVVNGKTVKNGYLPICRAINGAATTFYAHRVVFELAHGPVPPGMQVMHTCDNSSCVNPDHLTVGTPRQNSHDACRKGRVNAKLSREQATELITSPQMTTARIRQIAADAGCSEFNARATRNDPTKWAWLRKELGYPYEWRANPVGYVRKGVWNEVLMSYRQKKRAGLDAQITAEEQAEMDRYNEQRYAIEKAKWALDPNYTSRGSKNYWLKKEAERERDPEAFAAKQKALWYQRWSSMTPEQRKEHHDRRVERAKAWRKAAKEDPEYVKRRNAKAKEWRDNNPETVKRVSREVYQRRIADPIKRETIRENAKRTRARRAEEKKALQENQNDKN